MSYYRGDKGSSRFNPTESSLRAESAKARGGVGSSEEIIVNARLAGTREYLANAQKIAGANTEIGASSDLAGKQMERAGKRGLVMNQALFTVRRMMYGTTLAIVASGIAALRWGWQFNSAMQQARVALSPVFGSTKLLNKELDYLFNFTKYTPFQFKDVTGAFRMLYAAFQPLGISVDLTNQTIKALTDSLAYAGKTAPGQLNRVAIALQHMAYQGHLTGYAVTQLSRDGVPMMAILRKEFGLTGDQIHRIGTLGIPTLDVLRAINKYVETTPGFQNAAKRQAMLTFHGQFTTFKDNMGQIMGAVEKGWFGRLQGFLTRTNNFFNGLSNALKGNGSLTGIIGAVDTQLTPGSHGVMMFWTQLAGIFHEAWRIFAQLVSGVGRSSTVWATLYLGLAAVHGALWFIDKNMGLIVLALEVLLPMWLAFYTYTKLNALWLGILRFEEAILTKQMKDMTFAQMLVTLWINRQTYAEKLGVAMTLLYATATETWTGAQWSLAASLDASLFRLRALRLGLLGLAGLTVSAIVLLTLIPHAKANPDPKASSNNPVQKFFTKLPIVGGLASQVGAASDWINARLHRWHVPGFAAGGVTPYSGTFWVGERGPELATLPRGTSITANHDVGSAFNRNESWMRGEDRQPIILKISERVLEALIVDLRTGRLARA